MCLCSVGVGVGVCINLLYIYLCVYHIEYDSENSPGGFKVTVNCN